MSFLPMIMCLFFLHYDCYYRGLGTGFSSTHSSYNLLPGLASFTFTFTSVIRFLISFTHFSISYSTVTFSPFFVLITVPFSFCYSTLTFSPFFTFHKKLDSKLKKKPSRSNQQLATIENGDQPGGHPGIEVFLQNVYLRNFRHKYLLEIPTNKKCCHKQGTRGNGSFDPLATLRGDSSTLLRAGVSESSTSTSTRANLTHFSSAGELRHQHFSSQNINKAAISD